VLKGEKPLRLRKDPTPKRAARKTQRPSSAKLAPSFGGDPLAGELWERLRALRQDIAKEQGVPPYVIFSNRTLAQMVELEPSTDEELLQVAGVGQKKLERYGERFLAAIDG
jgi:ATP-dependent DNA helicase RecQ